MSTDCMDENATARMLDPDGVRHPLAKFAHVINVYLDSTFAVTSQAAEVWCVPVLTVDPAKT